MATIAPQISRSGSGDVITYTWETLVNTDDGEPIQFVPWGDRCVHIFGTFDTTTVVIEGSNNGTTWVTLNNVANEALSYTAAALEQIQEVPAYIRPRITADGGSGDIDVILVMRRANDLRQ